MSTNLTSTTCADILQRNNYTGVSCTCQKTFTLDQSFTVSELISKRKI